MKITLKYVAAVAAVVIFTWLLHEFAHWLTSEVLGYDSVMRINGTSSLNAEDKPAWHSILISASGPVITILQGLFAFLILKSGRWNKYLYALLFTAFYMRFLAGLMNFVNPNDEGRISRFLELGTFTLPLLVSAILFFMLYKISKEYHLNTRFQLSTSLIVMFVSSVLILADQFMGIRIL